MAQKTFLNKLLFKAGLCRWEIGTTLIILILFVFVKNFILPVYSQKWRDYTDCREAFMKIESMDYYPERIERVSRDIQRYSEILSELSRNKAFNESDLLEKIYRMADSVGCEVGKVEIRDEITLDSGIEVPVMFRGDGSYSQIAAFICSIEAMDYAARIRSAVLEKEGDKIDRGSLTLDFVILYQQAQL